MTTPDNQPLTRRAHVGLDSDSFRDTPPNYGTRLGVGCSWRFGSTDDQYKPNKVRTLSWGPHSEANSSYTETTQEAVYWWKHRHINDFAFRAPIIARQTFLREAAQVDVYPREAGQENPPRSLRYRVMGLAQLADKEIVIDLGFWLGPLVLLNDACDTTALAIEQSWRPCKETFRRRNIRNKEEFITDVVYLPQAQAGFSWGIVE